MSPQWVSDRDHLHLRRERRLLDHVAPPKGDRRGPGSRIPAIIVSPFAKTRLMLMHTYYDTTSIVKFITARRFGLEPLPGARAGAGDLTGSIGSRAVNLAARG